ncbi:MAG: ketoacyl-ACP synthase III [Arcobacter butzleri]|jgi:3-oxoacyl-[acyl-carrier-protein] synthase-3|nr:ketoacyl-ACP synthase III [Arcobacteraceae bacterium]MDY0364864.1 beta-ketoacyl-ACP synthase III [Arcobacteraceae bacterium]NLO17929.1 ketoacyl-ACP synthase III [Aliarcobacter butzleri]
MTYASFRSIGAYVPKNIRDNDWFVQRMDTSDEWITKRTGIKERRIASDEEQTSDLGVKAADIAIQRAGINKSEIDLIVCATISPDYLCMPSTACIIGEKLGLNGVMALDISAACTGFVYALSVAKAFIESGMKKNVLIIGTEKLSDILDYEDRTTCILFGDGAGAAIISATTNKDEAIVDVSCSADGTYADFLLTPREQSFIQMKGNETFKLAVKTLTSDVQKIMEKNNYTNSDIDLFIPHQANYRIIKAVGDALNFEESQKVLTIEKYGNTSSASIPMAINECYEDGRLTYGKTILLDAFGGGLTWGSAIVKFASKA